MKNLCSISAGLLAASLLCSCATHKESEERDANGKKIEYVYYTPIGSNVPVRVRKDQLQTSDSDSAATQKAVTDFQRESSSDKSPSAGGR